jgi:hypothetical protein
MSLLEPNFYFDSETMEYTNDKCPNKCGQVLVTWSRSDGPDDYIQVWYCPSCEEEWSGN